MLRDRRIFLTLLAGAAASPALSPTSNSAWAQAPAMSRITAFAFHFAGLSGGDIQLAEHAGKPILVVNTASNAATPRNMPGCRSCGRATGPAAS